MRDHIQTKQGELHKLQEIELHHQLASEYVCRYAPEFAVLFQQYWNDEIMAAVGSVRGRVLDCGSGTGVLLPILSNRFEHVHAIDLSADMLRVAVSREAQSNRRWALAVADAAWLPYSSEYFDCVVCRGSLHHMPNLDAVLRELYRVLRPGGRLVISEPCNDAWLVRMARRWLYARSDKFDEADEGYFSAEFRQRMQVASFRVLGMRRFGYLAYTLAGFPDVLPVLKGMPFAAPLTRVLIWVDRILARIPYLCVLGLHFVIKAQRDGKCEDT